MRIRHYASWIGWGIVGYGALLGFLALIGLASLFMEGPLYHALTTALWIGVIGLGALCLLWAGVRAVVRGVAYFIDFWWR